MAHRLTVYGEMPASPRDLFAVIREYPELCALSWCKDFTTEKEADQYKGPLLSAPLGAYDLWHETGYGSSGIYNEQLLVTPKKILGGGKVLYEKECLRLPAPVLKALEPLALAARIYVYGDRADDSTWEYLPIKPTQDIPKRHWNKEYVGVVHFETGEIR